MVEAINGMWPWYICGPLIVLNMYFLLFFGKKFGLSSNFRTICSMSGASSIADYFRFNWRNQVWNLVFVLGAIIGGFIAKNYLSDYTSVDISKETKEKLSDIGIQNPGEAFYPAEIFDLSFGLKPILILLIGGLLIGFGTRYGGGCTSGHAISGLSNVQLPSLVAVIGFFLGGLLMTHLLIPIIF